VAFLVVSHKTSTLLNARWELSLIHEELLLRPRPHPLLVSPDGAGPIEIAWTGC
jgi:hypothetical protein